MRAALSLAISLALASPLVHAAEGPDTFTESVVEFTVNGQQAATTLVVRRDADGTLLLRAADLATLRLKKPARGALLVNGERYYRLGTEMGARVSFDATTQHADVTLPPEAFLATVRSASAADLPRVTTPTLGGFLNYDLYGESTSERTSLGGIVEAGVFTPHGVGTNTLLSRDDGGSRSAVRLETTWTLDLPERLATLRLGDAISASGAWGRSVRFGGVQFGTNFATQPTLVTTPMLAARGSAVVPSTVDVFVNGAQVASQDVPPGPFTIDHVPSITGAGQMQVVITDALGRQQVLSQPYYTGPALLRAGLNEYSFELGSMREDYGYASNAYGDLVAAATFRRGFTDQITAEAHAEAQAGGPAAVGLNGAWQMGEFGILSATMAAGGVDAMGWLAGFGFEHNGQRSSLFARTQFASESFAQLGTIELENTPKQRTFVGFGLDFARYGNLQVAYGLQSYYDSETVKTVGVNYSVALGMLGYLGLYASHTSATDSETNVLLTWTLSLGDRRTLSTSLQQSSAASDLGGGRRGNVTLQRDLPAGNGRGYRMSLSSSDEQDGYLAYQGSAGTASVDYSRRNGDSGVRIGATGGLALTGAGLMPARQLNESFAVVQVADYPGLTVYADNQPVGRTDKHGRVLIEALRPYQRNEISVNPTQVPMDGSLSQSVIGVTPAYRSGALVRFPVERALAATMRVVQVNGEPVPAGASASLGAATFPVALDGLLYVEGLREATRVRMSWQGGQCSFEARRPAGTDPVPDLGNVTCK